MLSITDLISVLGFMIAAFSIGYTFGKDHGSDNDVHKK